MLTNIALPTTFHEFSLIEPVLKVLDDVGYQKPSQIQSQTIPHLLDGRDILAQSQTGTGKTAAFAFPLLSRIDLKRTEPQVLVLTPTRELAIQVAASFKRYAAYLRGFNVLPIYGGKGYDHQLRQLRSGAHVIVGTPGRIMDHMRRKTLNLKSLDYLVLDEADEMLRMGFQEDVEWILERTPAERQTALFSATLPREIRRIAQRYLSEPEEITVKVKTTIADTIQQHFWKVNGVPKFEALNRILEAETIDGVIVFVRTKTATIELAEKLVESGYAAAPLNGDIPQKQRERTIIQLKSGRIDILVATDVAARGLDIDRISHIINYDIPYDTEAYIHRIGRTGRAGRTGKAILFVEHREKRLLYTLERNTGQRISMMQLPSSKEINNKRIALFKQRITDALTAENLEFFSQLMNQYQEEHNVEPLDIAAALAKLLQGEQPLLLAEDPKPTSRFSQEWPSRPKRSDARNRKTTFIPSGGGMERFRLEVGRSHNIKARQIIGAISNVIGIGSDDIGKIDIQDDFTMIDLPKGIPHDLYRSLKKKRVSGRPLNIMKTSNGNGQQNGKPKRKRLNGGGVTFSRKQAGSF